MKASRLRDLFYRYLDAVNAREFERLPEFVHERVELNGLELSRDTYEAALRAEIAPVPDFAWMPDDVVAKGDRIAARLTESGTPTSLWHGFAPSHRRVVFSEFAFYRIRDGRIAEIWTLPDRASIAEQLRTAPPATAKAV